MFIIWILFSNLSFAGLSCAEIVLPRMTLPSSVEGSVRIPEEFLGHWTLLYFYPADASPGCSAQAAQYRDNAKSFKKHGVQIFGVNGGDLASHRRFATSLNLGFPLLVDSDFRLAKALGVYQVGQISRDTFLIGPDAKVRKIWRQVNPISTAVDTYEETLQLMKGS